MAKGIIACHITIPNEMKFCQHNYAPKRIFHNLIFESDQFNNNTNNGKMEEKIQRLFFFVALFVLTSFDSSHSLCSSKYWDFFVWYLLMSRLYSNTAERYTDELIAPEIIHKHRNDGGWQKYTACLSACAPIHVKRKLGNISTKACPMFSCAPKTEKNTRCLRFWFYLL